MEQGTIELRILLTSLRLHFPRSPSAAALAALGRLAQIAMRRSRFVARSEAGITPEILARIDACDAAAKGLIVVDPLRGSYFSLLSLLLALRSGEVRRIGRGLSMTAGSLIPIGGLVARIGTRLLATASRLANETGEPYLSSIVKISTGQVRLLEGRWREMHDLCESGVTTLKEQCRGIRWECDIAQMGAIRALEELGEVEQVRTRAETFLRESEEAGDLYGEVTARLYRAFWCLADDNPAQAREQAQSALGRWSGHGFNLQHFYAFRIEAYADLYEGEPERAWARVEQTWPLLVGARLLRVNPMRLDAHLLRARAALAVAGAASDRRASMLTQAVRVARLLSRERPGYAHGHAASIKAVAAALVGERSAAVDLLRVAEHHFQRADMQLLAACTSAYRSALSEASAADAASPLARLGLQRPQKWLAMWGLIPVRADHATRCGRGLHVAPL
jgi:hypothetical protein